jgi:hypothetical protein
MATTSSIGEIQEYGTATPLLLLELNALGWLEITTRRPHTWFLRGHLVTMPLTRQ